MVKRIDLTDGAKPAALKEDLPLDELACCLNLDLLFPYVGSKGMSSTDFVCHVYRKVFETPDEHLARRYQEVREYPLDEIRRDFEYVRRQAMEEETSPMRSFGALRSGRRKQDEWSRVTAYLTDRNHWVSDAIVKLMLIEVRHVAGREMAALEAGRYIAAGRSLLRHPLRFLRLTVLAACGGPQFLVDHTILFNAFFNRTKSISILKEDNHAYVVYTWDRKDTRLRTIRATREYEFWNIGCYDSFLRIDGLFTRPCRFLVSAVDIGDALISRGVEYARDGEGNYVVGGRTVTKLCERAERDGSTELLCRGYVFTEPVPGPNGQVIFSPEGDTLYDMNHRTTVFQYHLRERKGPFHRLKGHLAYWLISRRLSLQSALDIASQDRRKVQRELEIESAKVDQLTAEERQQRELAEAALARAEAAQQSAAEAHCRELAQSQQLATAEAQVATGKVYASAAAHDINNALGPARSGIEEILQLLRQARPAVEGHSGEAEAAEADFARQLGKVVEAELAGIAKTFEKMTGSLSRPEAELLLDRLEFLGRVSRTMREAIPDIYRGINRASDYTSFMSEMAHVDYSEARQLVGLDELLGELVVKYRRLWERQGIELEADLPEGIVVSGWPHVFESAFSNLLDNAAKAVQESEEKRVRVSLGREDERCVVTVEDTGPGIPEELREKVFELGYTTHPADGKGFGLAYVRNYVTLLGGDVSVQDRPEGGTAFVVQIPVSQTAQGMGQ